MLLYLHGFESSPQSLKIIQTQQHLAARGVDERMLVAPQQPVKMAAIRDYLDEVVSEQPLTAVMGSSLGGFWTHYVVSQIGRVQQRKVRGVLINPAVKPYSWMPQEAIERQHPYTQEIYHLDRSDREVLMDAERQFDNKAELLVLLQAGDERLDYRQARDYYQNQRMIVEQGGDHSFVDFPRYLPAALEFLNVL